MCLFLCSYGRKSRGGSPGGGALIPPGIINRFRSSDITCELGPVLCEPALQISPGAVPGRGGAFYVFPRCPLW